MLRDHRAEVMGRAIRRREEVRGLVRISAEKVRRRWGLLKVTIDVENTTDWADPTADRDSAMRRSLVAVHTLLAVDSGTFVSLLEPEPDEERAVGGCNNDGTFPVSDRR